MPVRRRGWLRAVSVRSQLALLLAVPLAATLGLGGALAGQLSGWSTLLVAGLTAAAVAGTLWLAAVVAAAAEDTVAAREQAVRAAAEEAATAAAREADVQAARQHGAEAAAVTLSRQVRALVDRQLDDLADLQAGERDSDRLAALFRVDHLARRLERRAANVLVLAGADTRRGASEPMPVRDVVRAAAGRIEQYPRVSFAELSTDLVGPSAVDDVIHLLAELLDNAAAAAPRGTTVAVASQELYGGGLRIAVADRGPGLAADALAAANARLRDPADDGVADGPQRGLAAGPQLGLAVVARLAQRHGIAVRLGAAPADPIGAADSGHGLIAHVDLPARLVGPRERWTGARAREVASPAEPLT